MNRFGPPKGVIAILVALITTALIGFAALTVDLAYVFVVRNELQNAADAAALSGAGRLYTSNAGPNWSDAETQAALVARLNKTEYKLIQDPQVSAGYWSTNSTSSIMLPTSVSPSAGDSAAVMVSIQKVDANRDGPVRPFFASILGKKQIEVDARAVAAVGSPSYVGANALFPFVMSKCMYDTYWNASSAPAGPRNDPKTGQPYLFVIEPEPKKPGIQPCEATGRGVWTTFFEINGGTNVVKDLITSLNPSSLKIGDLIWIPSGITAVNYGLTHACSEAGNGSCAVVSVAVVENLLQNTNATVIGFSCLKIKYANQGNKTITVQMTKNCVPPGSGGTGPDYGSRTPPRLVW
ncbi:MAG: hypothetical protein FGM22_01605 [Burkholderiaceae bacterium]|nr:hypothetical protein [Burkholderiaceae bacterium]